MLSSPDTTDGVPTTIACPLVPTIHNMDLVLPDKFKLYLEEAVGSADCGAVLEALSSDESVVSIRLNPFKPIAEEIDSVVNMAKRENAQIPWCRDGYYLKERPDFTLDPTLHAGAYYVQDASSMFLSLMEPLIKSKRAILDLCAAPGGKSTHLISMKAPEARFTANEVIRSRYSILKENLSKWGDHSVEVISLDPADFNNIISKNKNSNDRLYDLIVVDAPCSGEGLFRKDKGAIEEWSEDNVKLCAARQRRILSDIWNSLAPDGHLVYSTCTFNKYENEENILWLVEEYDAEIVPIEQIAGSLLSTINRWGIRRSDVAGYRFLPGIVKGEGQFFALIRKGGIQKDDNMSEISILKNKREKTHKNTHVGKSKSQSHKKKTEVIQPEVEDALAVDYNGEYPSVELSKLDALKYLSREAIVLKDAPLGYLRVTYGGLGLGFVKNIGSRANNLYPIGWRIRKSRF